MYILCIYSRAKIDREDCGGNRGVSHLRRDGGRTESEKADESSTYSDAIVSCSYVYAQRIYMWIC